LLTYMRLFYMASLNLYTVLSNTYVLRITDLSEIADRDLCGLSQSQAFTYTMLIRHLWGLAYASHTASFRICE
jgi:hypothetical protein